MPRHEFGRKVFRDEDTATILPLIDDGRIHLPCTVVHATKVEA
jgi:hypothetical protein